MAIASASLQTFNSTANAASLTVSYTAPAGTDRVLVVRVMGQRGAETDFTLTATWNSTAMTEAVTVTNTSTSRWYRTSTFYLALGTAAGTTTADVVVTAGASLQGFVGSIETLTGAHQTAVLGATGTDTGTDVQSDVTLTGVTAGSYMVGYVGTHSGGTPTWTWTNVTEDSDQNNGNNNAEAAGSGAYYANAGTSNVTFTATRSAGVAYAAVAAEFLAAPSGVPVQAMYYARLRK